MLQRGRHFCQYDVDTAVPGTSWSTQTVLIVSRSAARAVEDVDAMNYDCKADRALCVLQCGSCWAFSTTGSVEGINAIVTGELTSLSEQELIDCDTSRDHGCHGGLMDFAFGFIMQNGGLDTEKDYKYLALEEACNSKKEHRHIVTIDGYQDVPPNDEKSLLKVPSPACIACCL